ncbi:MAG: acetyl-CoA carboxylase carboxyltransferase subunit alpha [Vicinamibacteria bacterium]|nr:acetyl-CoA carboxylase carboxyltransferase subunit alpha [Vicinamibacteria bacterium]
MAEWDFEAPLKKLIEQSNELAQYPGDPDKERELIRLRRELEERRREIFSNLTPWQTTMVARHPNRPYSLDYVQALFTEFTELHGDRRFADDPAIVCGFALYAGRPVAVIGHQKGRDMKQKIYRNFGCPKPEGYRKALRVMRIAEKFRRPIITFVDTPGAYPGIDAEERGQAEAIAFNLREMSRLRTPIIVNVTGEGGSGGALAIAVGDRVNMLEHSIYSVISPEGCASILWRDAREAERAAFAMKITANDLKRLGVVDEIVSEPVGGAHLDHETTFRNVDAVIAKQMKTLASLRPEALVAERYRKFRNMGRLGQEFIQEDVASDAVIDERV